MPSPLAGGCHPAATRLRSAATGGPRRRGTSGRRRAPPPSLPGFPGKVVATALGDPQSSGTSQVVVSFWRPYRQTYVNAVIPRSLLVDRRGLTAHVGLYRPADRRELWVAGTLLRPVRNWRHATARSRSRIRPSTGRASSASAHGGGAASTSRPCPTWRVADGPRCADVDGDGRLDPVILARTSR